MSPRAKQVGESMASAIVGAAVTLGLLLLTGAAKWGGSQADAASVAASVAKLDSRVSAVERDRSADHDLLERVDARVSLLVCKLDPTHCAP